MLAAWAGPKREIRVVFDGEVRLSDLKGETRALTAGEPLTLTAEPVLIEDLPAALVERARTQKREQPYPWNVNYSEPRKRRCCWANATPKAGSSRSIADTTIADREWRRLNFSRSDKEGHYAYFWVDPQFAGFNEKSFEITAVLKRIAPDKPAGLSIDYESSRGYVGSDYRNISAGDGWQELSWTVRDASFAGAWGWNFRLNAISSPGEFLVKEVRVRRSP